MTLAHRIRMALLMRRANRLAQIARRSRDHLNRPHQPSVHLVGYPVPPETPIVRSEEHSLTFVWALAVVLVSGALFFMHAAADALPHACLAVASR